MLSVYIIYWRSAGFNVSRCSRASIVPGKCRHMFIFRPISISHLDGSPNSPKPSAIPSSNARGTLIHALKTICGKHASAYHQEYPISCDLFAPARQHWVQGLSPNTRYGFRVRAFNGFGPGSYAHGCFATRPARPAQPVVTRATPTEISLQWIFGNKFAAKVRHDYPGSESEWVLL